MPRCAIADIAVLDPSLRAAWNALRGDDPVLASPYFAPEFYEAVASVTRSARLLIAEDGGAPIALLPFQRRPAGLCGVSEGSRLWLILLDGGRLKRRRFASPVATSSRAAVR